jgi:hypothetical protein
VAQEGKRCAKAGSNIIKKRRFRSRS